MEDFLTTVIVDVGGHEVRFGTSDSEIPLLICSPCIEKKLYSIKNKSLVEESPWYENAVENGIIKNWSIIEDLMKHFINTFNIDPSKSSIIFTQSLASTEKDKDKAMDMLFDKFCFHSVCITSDAYLSFIASGKSTGCIVQLGHSITQFLPIIDDKPRISEAKWFNIGGSDISKLLIDEVELPYDLDRASPFAQQKLNNFKEKNCFVASDYRAEIEKHASEEEIRPESPQYLKYLKDSPIARMYQRLQKPLSKAIFEAPEILFEPSIAGKKEDYGIAEQLYEMIGSVKPMGYHGLLYSNIVLSGGTAKLKGLKERFAAEIDGYSPKLSKINKDMFQLQQMKNLKFL
uniref:Uncharacterized protein n=1 Tax=Panagrolaimus davidi TaxID=227884 RepID=A0A914RCR9_9BILA